MVYNGVSWSIMEFHHSQWVFLVPQNWVSWLTMDFDGTLEYSCQIHGIMNHGLTVGFHGPIRRNVWPTMGVSWSKMGAREQYGVSRYTAGFMVPRMGIHVPVINNRSPISQDITKGITT